MAQIECWPDVLLPHEFGDKGRDPLPAGHEDGMGSEKKPRQGCLTTKSSSTSSPLRVKSSGSMTCLGQRPRTSLAAGLGPWELTPVSSGAHLRQICGDGLEKGDQVFAGTAAAWHGARPAFPKARSEVRWMRSKSSWCQWRTP